jgi:hypothetical protein
VIFGYCFVKAAANLSVRGKPVSSSIVRTTFDLVSVVETDVAAEDAGPKPTVIAAVNETAITPMSAGVLKRATTLDLARGVVLNCFSISSLS